MSQILWSLPARLYCDPAVAQDERQKIFQKTWHFIAHESDLTAPGAYVTAEVAGAEIFVLRQKSGRLIAFRNLCRHRAAPLLKEGRGIAAVLRCPYHGWVYDEEGGLRRAPDFGLTVEDLSALRLFPVAVESWRGLIFASLEPGEALVHFLGDLPQVLGPLALEELRFDRRVTHDIQCNWKVYVENYNEGLHIPLLHPGLAKAVKMESYKVQPMQQLCLHKVEGASGDYSGTFLWHWPAMTLGAYGEGCNVTHVLPQGAGATRLQVDFFFTGAASATQKEQAIATTNQVLTEDFPICQAVQKNLVSGAYDKGPLSPAHEMGLAYFHELLCAAMGWESK